MQALRSGSWLTSRLLWLWAIASLLGSGAIAAYLVAPVWTSHPLLAITNWLTVVAFAITALLTADDCEHKNYSWLFLGCSVFWAAGLLGTRETGPLPLLATLCEPLVFVFITAILLRYPQSRPTTSVERRFFLVLVFWLLAVRTSLVVTSDPTWYGYPQEVWWPTLFTSQAISNVLQFTYYFGGAVIAIAFVRIFGAQLHRSRGIERRMLTPVIVAVTAVGITVAIEASARIFFANGHVLMVIWSLEAIVILPIPIAFLVTAILRRLAKAAIADLVVGVGRSGTIDVVQSELRRVLGDPGLEVLFWVPEAEGYVDIDGRPANVEAAAPERYLEVAKSTDGLPLAAIIGDHSLQRHTGLVKAAIAAIEITLENARLQARVLTQLEQLQASRARLVEAGFAERRRLERDLHDGAQQRLLAIAMQLATVPAQAGSHATMSAINQVRTELNKALEELRDLARGIHPAVLTQGGLLSALESVVERLPLTVELDVPAQRWNPAVEATAYFVVCEALSNTVKHASATRAHIGVRQQGEDLQMLISDNGVGRANKVNGSGLAGLHDRVSALGGELAITSHQGEGTEIIARIPCA